MQSDLHKGEVLLPPDVLGVHADKVVRVHNGVDEAVEHDSQVDVAVVASVHVHPVELRKHKSGNKCGNGLELGTYTPLVLVFFTTDNNTKRKTSRPRVGDRTRTCDTRTPIRYRTNVADVKRELIEKAINSTSSLVTIKLCA